MNPFEKRYCQSCGMPLRFDIEAYLGTNADQTRSDEYCYYCLKDGKYTVDVSREQMVDIWVKYTNKYNEYSNTNYSPRELRILLNKRMPTLKRWKQIENTIHIHHTTIAKITSYIHQHLFDELETEELSALANLSLFHFRRVFQHITGENIGSYIQRLRLEHIAYLLISTDLTIEEIMKCTHYLTKSSLAKAFKKHFGVTASEYRNRYQYTIHSLQNSFRLASKLDVRIEKIPTRKALCLPMSSIHNSAIYKATWKKIIGYYKSYLPATAKNKYISISMDDPFITNHKQCRFYLGFLINANIQPIESLTIQEIPGGLYTVFKHHGNYASLPELYRTFYENWLPQSDYNQKQPFSFEIYLNSPHEVDIPELLTEIYIPIQQKKRLST